jgi:FixJ family two-component response regulator
VRIIVASGIHDNAAAAKSVGRQVKDFLAKPFTSERLLTAVANAILPGA